MPLTTIDPTPALVVIDLQTGIVAMNTEPHAASDVVKRSAVLADAFRAKGWPVVLVNVDASPDGRTDTNPAGGGARMGGDVIAIVPELGDGIVVTKHTRGAFHETALHEELQARRVTQVFITGIATAAGVEETGREAFARGYHVVMVSDAMADRSLDRHDYALSNVFPSLSQVTTAAEVLAAI